MPEDRLTDQALLESGAAGYVVDRVVICDAFREPNRHYELVPGRRSHLKEGRRPSLRYRASARQVKGGVAGVAGKESGLFEDMLAAEEQLNDFVNGLREEIRVWRSGGWQGTAIVTGKLLDWWFSREDERRATHQRFFFCQQEAVEALIYLYEIRRRQKMPETGDLLRYALKLATGTGKTVVMALLIVWSTLHKRKVAGSTLSSNFLVLVPNLTVRDRVSGIDERTGLPTGAGLDPISPENLYELFDMVPPEFSEDFRPTVMVRNWHAIPLVDRRDDWIPQQELIAEGRFIPASILATMQHRQPRDSGGPIRRYLGGWGDLVIINDEAHHVYGEKRGSASEEPGHIKWSRIIKEIGDTAAISLVVDLSATPWYGSGSPKPDGTLFEWLVSDFSVYDAFESGLVKVVRLPDPDAQGRVYLDLWDLVKQAKTKEEYLRAGRGAIEHIYSGWKKDFLEWEKQLVGLRAGPPPVMLVVANDATRARWLFEHLTSQYAELLGNPDPDDPHTWFTIQVDSKVFDADRGNEATLREMVNTVGQPRKPGEHVRCIVSVNMLSEGWDVKNVTHIIGFRAFGSPLLTEQVIGRGLRRTDYTVLNQPIEERLANVNRPDEETVDAFGIPFVGFPVERRKRPRAGEWGHTPRPIEPDPKKIRFSVWVPNVRSWALTTSEPLSEVIDVNTLERMIINPRDTPTEVRVRPVVGGSPEELMNLNEFRAEFPLLRSTFNLARELYGITHPANDQLELGPTFEEILEFVSAFVERRVSAEGSSEKADIGIYFWTRRALDILETAVQGAPAGTMTVPILGDPEQLESGRIRRFNWTGILAKGKKCHLSSVPCHTDLEREFADFLDSADDVVRYLKNERFGFSVTYYENNRARQYFPDFIVLGRSRSVPDVWYMAETKGEIRTNTELKRQAAELWCERMTRSGNGTWRHLFVPQRPFEKALAAGVKTLKGLGEALAAPTPLASEPIRAGTD